MKRAVLASALAFIVACSGSDEPRPLPEPPSSEVPATTVAPAAIPTTAPAATSTSTTATAPASTTTTTTATTIAATTTTDPATHVTSPGTYGDYELVIHVGFRSEVPDVTTAAFQEAAMGILNSAAGWNQSGFTFVADAESDLIVVLAEGPRVDEMCLPLETYGSVNCQNGPVVALNADRWRKGGRDWDSTVEAYRVYVVTHEVGHLIGLRHPRERCPTADGVSAVMEPQTNNLDGCVGNGIPMGWEIEWARNRPAVVGPTPDWDGPRPEWPVP